MSDSSNTNLPLDTTSNTDPTATNPTDPSTTSFPSAGPNSTDPTSTSATDPNAGTTTDPNTTTNPNAGTGNIGGTDSNAETVAQSQTAGSTNSSPSAVPAASSASPSAISGSDNTNALGFSNQGNFRNAIIIASAVSGAVGIILVVVVIFMVYRRRNRRRSGTGAIPIIATPRPRAASDSTWIGTRISPAESFNDDKLEAGDRGSKADSVDSDATLHDAAPARGKSDGFRTPTHTPRPSMDKLKIMTEALVPRDPSEVPRMSNVSAPRPSVEQAVSQGLPLPRSRKAAPGLRVDSSSFDTGILVEQGNPSPDLPLVTPVSPAVGWRSPANDYDMDRFAFLPPPAHHDSVTSLSRQSSHASSRNSPDVEVVSPRKKSAFSTITKKRRSRGDSIDPFRKSAAASMMARRRSARSASRADASASRSQSYSAGGVVRRKSGRASRADSVLESAGPDPNTPGGRRKSSTPSVPPPATPRRRSPATDHDAQIFSAPITPVLPGLPKTPRTAAAVSARSPRPVTPRTSGIPTGPLPQTPRTAPLNREPSRPRTPRSHARTPRAGVPRTPTSLEDAHWEYVEYVPLPEPDLEPIATPMPRPLPATPRSARPLPQTPSTPTTGRAELRLSQLSRALSEVSRESSA